MSRVPQIVIQALERRVLLSAAPAAVGAQVNVSNTSDMSEGPSLSANGQKVQAVWGERNNREIRFSELNVATNTWGSLAVFADGAKPAQQFPDVSVGSGGANYVVYATDVSGSTDPIYARTRAGGVGVFGPAVQVATDNFANPVRIGSDTSGNIWAVWRNNDGSQINWRRSIDGGATWPTGGNLVSPGSSANGFSPDIALGPDGVPHVVYYLRGGAQNGNTIRTADWNGSGWTLGTIGDEGAYAADPVTVFEPNGTQHLLFRKTAGSGWTLRHMTRAPGGAWSNKTDVYTTAGDSGYVPGLAVDAAGAVHVTFSERAGSVSQDWYTVKPPGSNTWTTRINLATHSGYDTRTAVVTTPDAAGGGANLTHIIYQQGLSGQDVDDIIYARFRTDYIAPTIDVVDVTPDPRQTNVPSINIVFSEVVSGFSLANVQLTRNGSNVALTGASIATSDNKTFTVSGLSNLTETPGTYVLTANVNGVADAFANAPAAGASDTWVNDRPAWLAAESLATWNAGTHVLTVNGAATIVADPGADVPVVNATGAAAVLTIKPTSGLAVHLAALNLSNGATATLSSLGAARTAANHRVLVVNAISIDGTSALDLTDNDLIVDYPDLNDSPAQDIEGDIRSGQPIGSGIRSSVAANDDNFHLGIADNALLAAPFGTPQGGELFAGQDVGLSVVLVKFTHRVDLNLDGKVDASDATIFGTSYSPGDPTAWYTGDIDMDGFYTPNDATLFGTFYDPLLPLV